MIELYEYTQNIVLNSDKFSQPEHVNFEHRGQQ